MHIFTEVLGNSFWTIWLRYLAVRRSFYSPDIRAPQRLGDGLQSWFGFYQSIRPTQMGLSLNIGEICLAWPNIYLFLDDDPSDTCLLCLELCLRPSAGFRYVIHGVYRAAAGGRFRDTDSGERCHVKTAVGCEPNQGKFFCTYVLSKPVR
jgi:hypothetical protein